MSASATKAINQRQVNRDCFKGYFCETPLKDIITQTEFYRTAREEVGSMDEKFPL